MDKVAIVTWCNKGINYGQVLQAYAIHGVVKKYGYDPIIINYRKLKDDEGSILLESKHTRKSYEWYLGLKESKSGYIKTKLKFNKFVKDFIGLSYPCYTKLEIEELMQSLKCKTILCGSDQIWNPACFDPIYYLDFCNADKGIRRIAYAPSIAENNLNSRNLHIFKNMTELINKIDYVSVREEDSAKVIRTLTNKAIMSLLDPTFLISKKGWQRIASKKICEESYVFCYILGDLRRHKHNIKKIANKYKTKKVVYLNTNIGESYFNDMFLNNVGPREFISLIRYAKAIYTDSFHGVALSINLNKEFYACRRFTISAYNKESRITNVLDVFNLNSRYIDVDDHIDDNMIDYDEVNMVLKKERRKAFDFLDEAFQIKRKKMLGQIQLK